MSLAQFVEQENRSRKFFNKPAYDVAHLSPAEAQEIFWKLDSNLSPENLACDGERPRAEQIRLGKLYRQAFSDLRALGFAPQGYCYNA